MGFYFGGVDSDLKLIVVLVVQLCDHQKHTLKWVGYIVCEFSVKLLQIKKK